MLLSFLILFAYLLGSVSSAIIVCRLMGLPDPREQGSGNPGATNVMRIGGKKAAAITFFGDFLKGLIPVLMAKFIGAPSILWAIVGLAAFLGHLYPIFFGFKGGKGVATSAGVLIGFDLFVGSAVILTWITIYKLSKISSLAALITSTLAPFYTWFLTDDPVLTGAVLIMTGFLLWRHESNIRRLLNKVER
ncbi:MAG: glycerol-3-phosphate 1-O-acyltransferase PlsY [Methylococcales bacterium]|nr:glycerol-3-phosphate 1-O-acyltransferase PlsY [Methylococcales bacterium]